MNQSNRSSRSQELGNRKKVTIDDVGRLSLVAWAFYYFFPQFTANVLLQMHGVSFAYTGFYWLANGFMFAIILLTVWKYHHPLAQMAILPVFLYVGYASTRLFIDDYIEMNFGIVIFSGVVTAHAILNLFLVIKNMVRNFARRAWFPKMRVLKRSKVFKIAGIGSIAWFGLVSWSYFGFSQQYTVRDFNQDDLSIYFWNLPSYSVSDYNTTYMNATLEKMQELNSSFYVIVLPGRLNANYATIFDELEKFGLGVILDVEPVDPVTGIGDYVSYHYIEQMNDTYNHILEFLGPGGDGENVTNIRGISYDVEGPNYWIKTRSWEQYYTALDYYQWMLDNFTATYPGTQTFLIQMAGIMYDFYDDDHDLDVAQRTVSTEMDWDYYGFMTYHVNPSPGKSTYTYAMDMQQGIEQWGAKFQPWVGWWYREAGKTPDIEVPGVYERSLDYMKIAKSFGVEQIVLAPLLSFLNFSQLNTTLDRLDDLIEIKNGFETFTIPIHDNMRLFTDWDLYWEKIVPYYVMANHDVVKDLYLGTPGNWFTWVQIIQCAVIVFLGILLKVRKK
ncbi:MAG: hypothetical protein ACFFCS_14125 [Candidatus Hodarchaeota archaeon]